MDFEHTRARIEALYQHYTDRRQVEQTLLAFDRKASTDVEAAWLQTLTHFYAHLTLAQATDIEFGPGKLWDGSYPIETYNASLSGATVVDLLYPHAEASTREPLVALINDGYISQLDWLHVWVDFPLHSQPSYTEIVESLLTHPHVQGEGWMPLPLEALNLDPAAHPHVEWLLAIYVGTFARAPEWAGLQYWAQALAEALTQADSVLSAYKAVARDIAWAAQQHGEWPDLSDPAQFVNQIYQQVLGREADAVGLQYWSSAIAAGEISHSEFIAVFLNSALQSHGDASYLHNRIAVAAYAAQPEISGPGTTPPDLAAILHGVSNLGSALQAIDALCGTNSAPRVFAETPETSSLVFSAVQGPELAETLPSAAINPAARSDDPYATLPEMMPDFVPVGLPTAGAELQLYYNEG